MDKKISELSKEQRIELGEALLDKLDSIGYIYFKETVRLDNEIEVCEMSKTEASECIKEYLDSVDSNIDEWMWENDIETFWDFKEPDYIYTREGLNEELELGYEDFVGLAEMADFVSETTL